jgi:hypothetical protein
MVKDGRAVSGRKALCASGLKSAPHSWVENGCAVSGFSLRAVCDAWRGAVPRLSQN